MTAGFDSDSLSGDLREILDDLERLRVAMAEAESLWSARIAEVSSEYDASARNLAHYWAIRQQDLRDLQRRLARLGLSSLGRSEPHVDETVDVLLAAAQALAGSTDEIFENDADFDSGAMTLAARAAELFGPEPARRQTRIMVTLPSEAAHDPDFVESLVRQGMDLARINCAHDGPMEWLAMVRHVRAASASTGRSCRIAMDLAGPKLRTGPFEDGPAVVKLKPQRDSLGRVLAPARCWIGPPDDRSHPVSAQLPVLPVQESWPAGLAPDAVITLRDARGARRRLTVEAHAGRGVIALAHRTAYITNATVLDAPDGRRASVGPLPASEQYLTLRRDDTLVLTRDCRPAHVPTPGSAETPSVGCTLPAAFDTVVVGNRVHFDDGKIAGTVTGVRHDEITVKITNAASRGSRLRAGKGINLPDTVLPVSALTDIDRTHLAFAAEHADIVSLSFARTPRDVEALLAALADSDNEHLGVVVKIETAQAFENLPEILFAVMRHPRAGVMIARGDLAVECGYERLAEVQEEILWLCEAAHLPVIWATQVLDQLATYRPAVARRDHRRRDGRAGRVRDAQQGPAHPRCGDHPGRHPVPDGGTPLQEERSHATAAGMGNCARVA